jgi:hypothetical protein
VPENYGEHEPNVAKCTAAGFSDVRTSRCSSSLEHKEKPYPGAPTRIKPFQVATAEEERLCILRIPMTPSYRTLNHPLRQVTSIGDVLSSDGSQVLEKDGKIWPAETSQLFRSNDTQLLKTSSAPSLESPNGLQLHKDPLLVRHNTVPMEVNLEVQTAEPDATAPRSRKRVKFENLLHSVRSAIRRLSHLCSRDTK